MPAHTRTHMPGERERNIELKREGNISKNLANRKEKVEERKSERE